MFCLARLFLRFNLDLIEVKVYNPTMAREEGIQIKSIFIQNYKGIDLLELDFPNPSIYEYSNICVLGSKNGMGKTSLLECIALLTLAAYGELEFKVHDIDTDFIHAGADETIIRGVFLINNEQKAIKLVIDAKGNIAVDEKIDASNSREFKRKTYTIGEVMGLTPEPVNAQGVFFIHGYRKVQEGRLDLGSIVGDDERNRIRRLRYSPYRMQESALSSFKISILEWQLSKADLLVYPSSRKLKGNEEALGKLNKLLEKYAQVTLDKIKAYGDGTMSLLVKDLKNTKSTFPIDGLSSGQKEIISTLFMIWETTRDKSTIVLIDEPELHLNSHWHKSFIRDLIDLSPDNQYIIATHSEQIMASVSHDKRYMLQNNE